MASSSQIDLLCNRTKRRIAVCFADGDENDKAFNQRQQCCDQTNKDNALLNAKSRAVIQELSERHWALMYLQHLANRVNQTEIVEIQFSDLPPIASLSLYNPERRLDVTEPCRHVNHASVKVRRGSQFVLSSTNVLLEKVYTIKHYYKPDFSVFCFATCL